MFYIFKFLKNDQTLQVPIHFIVREEQVKLWIEVNQDMVGQFCTSHTYTITHTRIQQYNMAQNIQHHLRV